MFGSNWKQKRDAKLAERAEQITTFTTRLSATATVSNEDLLILSCTSVGIVSGIEAGRWTATQVLEVFVRSALRAQAAVNPATEILFAQAFAEAKVLDDDFAKTGKLVGQLHGLPISVKDQIDVKGFDSSLGFSHECFKPATEDATLVKILREAGAVVFIKSNTPQTMMTFESTNPIWGTTLNPHDPKKERTAGGSSSGEAALLGSDGIPLGFGSDIGGSLRIPAHFSGCYGLKPVTGRYSVVGAKNPSPGFEAIKSTLGPMGRSVADLELACRVVFDASIALSRVESLLPLPFREVTLPAKLKFGYYTTDGFCRASPASRRAVLESVEALRKLGHECVEFEPVSPFRGMEIFVALTSAGGYKALLANLHGDPQDPSLFLTTLGVKIPGPIRGIASTLVNFADPIMSRLISASKVKSVDDTQKWLHLRDLFVEEFRRDVWGTRGFDAILCATQSTPAVKNGATAELSPLAIGTILYNVVDSSVGCLPVTFVDPLKDAITDEWRALDKPGSKLVEDRVFGPGGAYNAEEMKGLPVAIQVVGAALEEEKVLKIMALLDGALGERGFSPGDFTKRQIPAE